MSASYLAARRRYEQPDVDAAGDRFAHFTDASCNTIQGLGRDIEKNGHDQAHPIMES
jgi:hypothetical protein